MSRTRISLEQWGALVAVVEAGSYAKAAERLHKSQSSISYAVQQLQSQLGVQAFRTEGRKAVLTPTGELLVRQARHLLDDAAALEQSSTRLSAGWEAEIRLAVEVIYPTWQLFEALARFGRECPYTRIELIESVIGHRTDVLETGAADLAIFGSPPPGHAGEPLMRVRFLPVAHPGHPLHRLGRPLSMRDLRAHRHLVVRESSPARPTAPLAQAPQRWTFGHLATSIEAACAGHGFAWLPEERIRQQLQAGLLRPLPMRSGGELFADLYLVFAERSSAGPGVRRLAEILREQATQAPTPGAAAKPAA